MIYYILFLLAMFGHTIHGSAYIPSVSTAAPAAPGSLEALIEKMIRIASHGNLTEQLLQDFVALGVSINAQDPTSGFTALIGAALGGHANTVELLLAYGADPSIRSHDGMTALQLRMQLAGHTDIIKMLRDAAKRPSKKSIRFTVGSELEIQMIREASAGTLNRDSLSRYLKRGANINARDENGETALIEAALNDKLDIVELLLNEGADINAKDVEGDTPLSVVAASNGPKALVDLLVARGATVDSRDMIGNTPLFHAASEDHLDMVKLLESHGAELDTKNDLGQTPLRAAAEHGYIDVVTHLIDSGVDVNSEDEVGNTPLIVASERGYKNIAEMLLQAGAQVNQRNKAGETALFYANKNFKQDSPIVVLLKKATREAATKHIAQQRAVQTRQLIKDLQGILSKPALILNNLVYASSVIKQLSSRQLSADEEKSLAKLHDQWEQKWKSLLAKMKEPVAEMHRNPTIETMKMALKSVRRTIKDFEPVVELPNMADFVAEMERVAESINQRLQEELKKVPASAPVAPATAKPKPVSQNAEAKQLLASLHKALEDNNLEASEKYIAEIKMKLVTDPALQQKITQAHEQFKEKMAAALQARFEKAFAAYKQRPTDARLREAQDIIELIEDLKMPALKEFTRLAHQQIRAIEKEGRATPSTGRGTPSSKGSPSPIEQESRISPPLEKNNYLIFDPYQVISQAPEAYQSRIQSTLEEMREEYENADAKELKQYAGLWRVRVGDYRIIYKLMPAQQAIGIVEIAQRGKVYDDKHLLATREEDFIKLNTYSPEELLSQADTLLKTNKPDDVGRAAAFLDLYRWLLRDLPADEINRSEYLKSLLLSATAQLKFNEMPKARDLFNTLISQAIDYPAYLQQARVGLAEVERKAQNFARAAELLGQARDAAKSAKERKDIEERLERLKQASPTPDDQVSKLKRKLSAAERLMAVDPDRAEIELEGFLKESSSYEALAHEREEANKLLNQIGHRKNCDEQYAKAVDAFEAGTYDDAVDHFKAYRGICAPYITPERQAEVQHYIDQAPLAKSVAAARARRFSPIKELGQVP